MSDQRFDTDEDIQAVKSYTVMRLEGTNAFAYLNEIEQRLVFMFRRDHHLSSELFDALLIPLVTQRTWYTVGKTYHPVWHALRHQDCPKHLLDAGFHHESNGYQQAVTQNPNCPEEYVIEFWLKNGVTK